MSDMGIAMDHGSMAGMDMGNMPGMDHAAKGGGSEGSMSGMDHAKMPGMDMSNMPGMDHSKMPGMNHGGTADSSPSTDGVVTGSNYAPGSGLAPQAPQGERVLVYGDLKSVKPYAEYRAPDREIVLKLTGNMERYFWSINGKKYSEAKPIRLHYGERVRFKFVNETMMSHPMHLHGMWMQLDTGNGKFNPLKHTVNVAPGTTLSVDVPADAVGQWAFHCHLLYHMATGMFRTVIVEPLAAAVN